MLCIIFASASKKTEIFAHLRDIVEISAILAIFCNMLGSFGDLVSKMGEICVTKCWVGVFKRLEKDLRGP